MRDAAASAVACGRARPAWPVKTLALPALTTRARAMPPARASRHQSIGAPGQRFCVKTPATAVPAARSTSQVCRPLGTSIRAAASVADRRPAGTPGGWVKDGRALPLDALGPRWACTGRGQGGGARRFQTASDAPSLLPALNERGSQAVLMRGPGGKALWPCLAYFAGGAGAAGSVGWALASRAVPSGLKS